MYEAKDDDVSGHRFGVRQAVISAATRALGHPLFSSLGNRPLFGDNEARLLRWQLQEIAWRVPLEIDAIDLFSELPGQPDFHCG